MGAGMLWTHIDDELFAPHLLSGKKRGGEAIFWVVGQNLFPPNLYA